MKNLTSLLSLLVVFSLQMVRADVNFASSSVAAGGFDGGYSQSYTNSSPFPLASTPSSTTLIVISDTWENAENTTTTYSQTITGGTVAGSSPSSATFAGTISLLHGAGSPRDGAFIWFGTAEPYFDLVLDTESNITASLTLNNQTGPSNGTQIRFQTLNVYDWSWNYIDGSDLIDTTDETYFDTWEVTLGPGSYRFAPFAGINSDSSWQGAAATLDYDFNIAAVPEPATYALLALAAVGLGANVLRRKK